MESSSPKWRFVLLVEFGLGWGLGMLLIPMLNGLTMNYRLYLVALLLLQLFLLIWLKYGVFESIRWLISEAQISGAQIELQRACRINNIQDGTQLAQKIAQIQVQQVQKASSVLEQKLAPEWSNGHAGRHNHQAGPEEAAIELGQLGAQIGRSFSLRHDRSSGHFAAVEIAPDPIELGKEEKKSKLATLMIPAGDNYNFSSTIVQLSPTLAKKSFSCQDMMRLPDSYQISTQQPTPQITNKHHHGPSNGSKSSMVSATGDEDDGHTGGSKVTTHGLIQLALSYSKTVRRQEEGSWFISRMFHRKLYKPSLILILFDLILESIYFVLVEANNFDGSNVYGDNHLIVATIEWIVFGLFILILCLLSRHISIICPTLISSLICLALALNYHLIPDHTQAQLSTSDQQHLVALREEINSWLIPMARLSTEAAILAVATVAMETYPNNLRQTGPATIMFAGRMGSILAPFLLNDDFGQDKQMLQVTLIALGALGITATTLVPLFIQADTKDRDLIDNLSELQ